MSEPMFDAARSDEVERIRALQRAGGRMWEDICLERSLFFVCRAGEELCAWVGLELEAPSALLRSLFTVPEQRKLGLGRRLVRHAEAVAAGRGARAMYLFSTGAGAFFMSQGYSEVPVHETVAALPHTPQVEWYLERPALLAREVSYRRELARPSSGADAPPKRPA
jgi:N-acetylglutamate synthase-like GNAT family acetyltransferase